MKLRSLVVLLVASLVALAGAAAAHHGRGGHEAPPEEPEPEPCACDPVPPQPIDVVIGDGWECVGGSSGELVVDGKLARATVRYCKPWVGPHPVLP